LEPPAAPGIIMWMGFVGKLGISAPLATSTVKIMEIIMRNLKAGLVITPSSFTFGWEDPLKKPTDWLIR